MVNTSLRDISRRAVDAVHPDLNAPHLTQNAAGTAGAIIVSAALGGTDHQEAALVRHTIRPIPGYLLMLIPIYGSVWPIPAAPYIYFLYLLVAYIVVGALIASHLARTRPRTLRRAGAVRADGKRETELAHD